MAKAEENSVNLIKRHLVGEVQGAVAHQPFMYVAHQVAGIAFAVGKDNFCLWVVQQQADQLTTRVACCASFSRG